MLSDQAAITLALDESGNESASLASVLRSAAFQIERLQSETECPSALAETAEMAELAHEGIRLSIKFPLVVPIQNLNPEILVMQPAEDGNCCDATELLRPSKIRGILIQREMRPNLVVIGGVILEDVAQVRFAKHHKVVE